MPAAYFLPGRGDTALCKSPGGVLRASFLAPQSYFLVVGAGPALTPLADNALCRAPHRTQGLYPMYCSVFSARPGRDRPSTSSTSPLGPCSVPRSSFPSVTSSLWVPGLYRNRWGPDHSVVPSAHTGALSDALQRVLCQARLRPPLNVLCKSLGAVLRTSVLVLQCYFLVVGGGSAPTSPADRTLHRAPSAHGRFIRCTAACYPPGRGETALQRPLQVPRGCAPCLVTCSPALLPRCGCRAGTNTTGGPRIPLRPQRTRALFPMHCSVLSARPEGDRPSTSSTSPLRPCSVPRSSFPSVTSSLWVPGLHYHCRWITHSAVLSAHTGALSDALQRLLWQVGARSPSSGKRRSRRQDRVTTRIPGLDDGRKLRGTGSSEAPHAPGSDSPSLLWTPSTSGYRLSRSMVPESGLYSRINCRPLRSHVFKCAPSWLLGHAPSSVTWLFIASHNNFAITGLLV
ncbi:hypothetical protein NDU88_007347 [Pleurodeles waltl]|uniref:Uncharacterized protein n=1 Tax=Pleurodeles waltl TaxID=8319 RepID=A0AAV7N372_PLEWA|nr:hypothetical protein NDU88_007347 [Pleurodeles waltl]